MQTLGETAEAMRQADERTVEQYIESNKHNDRPFWLVIACKTGNRRGPNGEFVINRGVRAYYTEVMPPIIGTRMWRIHGKSGRILQQRNYPHDAPIDMPKLAKHMGNEIAPTKIPSLIAGQYFFNN